MSIPNGQAQMEQSIRDSLAELERRQDTISGMMALHFEEYDEAGPSLTLSLVPAPWMSNPMGVMHGGIVSSALDLSLIHILGFWKESISIILLSRQCYTTLKTRECLPLQMAVIFISVNYIAP